MVATLVRLRWRITLNALGRSVWILLAALLGAAWAFSVTISVGAGAVALGLHAPAPLASTTIGALGALATLGWTLVPLLLTFLCMYLLRKGVNALWLIFGIFGIGILGFWLKILAP